MKWQVDDRYQQLGVPFHPNGFDTGGKAEEPASAGGCYERAATISVSVSLSHMLKSP